MRSNNEQESTSRNTSNFDKDASRKMIPSSSSPSITNDTSTTTSRKVSKRERLRKAMIQFAKHEFTKSKHSQDIEKIAPISPTPLKLLNEVMPHLHINVNSRIIELGCGDARWLLYLCQRYNCQGIGVDIDQERLALARSSISQLEESSKILIQERDIFDFFECTSLNEKDVLIMYLFRDAMVRIASMLNEEGWRCAFDVNDNNSKEKKKDGESQPQDIQTNNIQIVCIGFTLPGYKAIWSSQVEGIRCYIYHCRK